MTYHVKTCNYRHDRFGRPWSEKTLRIFHNDDRDCWSITEPSDKMYGTSWLSWYNHGGEVFTEGLWIKLKGGLEHVEVPASQE